MQNLISASRDGLNFGLKLSCRKLINYVKLIVSYYFSLLKNRPLHIGMPATVSIEPTTSCNLRCPECPSGLRKFTRPQGKMSIKEFRNIIDRLKKHLMVLMLYFQGEPLLNPEIFEMISYAHKKRVYTATSTNGHFLDNESSKKLVESGLDRLIISIDGSEQETYERYRRTGNFETVKEGVKNIVKWKKELKSSKPFIIIQFLVLKNNEHQISAMKKMAKELGADKLELKSAQVRDFKNDSELIPENLKYARYSRGADGHWELKKPIRNRCFRMWSGAVITWDGRVVPCCFDKDAGHQLGQLDNLSFKDIWKGEAYKEFRSQILEDRSKIDICCNCTE